jgi:hypothetical protein
MTASMVGLGLAMAVSMNAQATNGAANHVFQVPAGWLRFDSPNATTLSPRTHRGQVTMFLSGRDIEGSFRAAFESEMQGMRGQLLIVNAGEARSGRSKAGFDLLSQTVELGAADGSRSARFYLAANPPGRLEIMVFAAPNLELFQRFWPDVEAFAETWTFTNSGRSPEAAPGPAAMQPPPSGNRIAGIYKGYKYNFTTVLGAVQKRATEDYLTFYPDGFIYHGLPFHGWTGLDRARALETNPEITGSYEIVGNRVNLTLNRGQYRLVGMREGPAITIDGRPYTLLGDPARLANPVLDGVFMREDARPGEDLARRAIRFTAAGQFEDRGIVQTITPSEIINGNPRNERPGGSGTYRLESYTLRLRYSDGYERTLPLVIDPAEMDRPAQVRLSINRYSLVRR